MQSKIFLALAAAALTVSAADPAATETRSGVPEANQGAKGPVAFGGAMDFSKSSKGGSKRDVAPPSVTTASEDIPWIPEWTPGASFIWEAPEQFPTSTPAAPKGQGPEISSVAAVPTSIAPVASVSSPVAPIVSSPAAPIVSSPAAPVVSSPVAPVASSPVSSISKSSDLPKGQGPTSKAGSSAPLVPSTTHLEQSSTHAPTLVSSGTKTGAGPVTSKPGSGTTPAPVAPGGHGPLTFNIVNKMGGSITISYQLGTYSPPTGGATTVAPALVGPSASTGTFATSTQVVAPVGWAGRMTIGKAGAALDYRGTKIEGNNGFDGADPTADPDPDVDVSYVDGYSVPASCSCGDVVLSGCNKELFNTGIKCSNLVGDAQHPVCVNDPRNIHGPATPFFAPCANAAYTYDYNDVANWQGTCPGNTVTCCIGTDCPAPTRQLAGNSKREVMAMIGARKRSEAMAKL